MGSGWWGGRGGTGALGLLSAAGSPIRQAQGRLSGDAGMTGARRARDGGWARLGMCSGGQVDVFSFWVTVSSFRAYVFSFEGDVSTLAGDVSSFRRCALVGDGAWKELRDSSAPLRCARNDNSGGGGALGMPAWTG